MLMVEAMEHAGRGRLARSTGERIRDGFYARQNWVARGFDGCVQPSTFTSAGPPRHAAGRSSIAAVVTANTAQGSVDELMRAAR
jgi:branched-chain amino acid transport system substrate-binding protein